MSAAGCDCRPGSRCRPCRERGRAHFRFYSVGARLHPEIREVTKLRNPVEWANQQTSYHDCRVALCLAMGVPLERIDPCTGHNLTNTNHPAAASFGGRQRPGRVGTNPPTAVSPAAPPLPGGRRRCYVRQPRCPHTLGCRDVNVLAQAERRPRTGRRPTTSPTNEGVRHGD